MLPVPAEVAADERLLDFVRTALQQKHLSGICEMLHAATIAMEAWGAFLWQVVDDVELTPQSPAPSLFVLAEWFPEGKSWAFEYLEMESISGWVVTHKQTRVVNNAPVHPGIGRGLLWWIVINDVRHLCCTPVQLSDGASASLSFYRNSDKPFTEAESTRAGVIGRLFAPLYESIRNDVSFRLLRETEKEIVKLVPSAPGAVTSTLRAICILLSQTFKCFETSVFLEDRLTSPGVFNQVATTWPEDELHQTKTYSADAEGITPWILRNRIPVRLFNLGSFKSGVEINPDRYPGMIWKDPLDLVATMAARRGVKPEDLHPLSYMAVPVMAGGKLMGVIRCCAAEAAPYYFAQRELRLLELVATDIGQYWDNCMRGRELAAETLAWKYFIDNLRDLNERVGEHLASALPNEDAIEKECRAMSLQAGAASMQEVLNQQTKLYKLLCGTVRSRLAAEDELRRQSEADKRFYQDLFHQLKSPVFTAAATARFGVVGRPTVDGYRNTLMTLRGQLLKAERVTRAVQLFAELAKGREPHAELAPLDYPTLVRTLGWAADDHARLFEDRRLRFTVERHGIAAAWNHVTPVDFDLAMHAINNLLDNAGKYSFPGNTVRIFGGLTGTGRFHVSVASKGLRLKPGEAAQCTEREWRSDHARLVTGEGSGLGLWIVDQIMRAHGGQVLIQCPNAEDEFEVKLLFPSSK